MSKILSARPAFKILMFFSHLFLIEIHLLKENMLKNAWHESVKSNETKFTIFLNLLNLNSAIIFRLMCFSTVDLMLIQITLRARTKNPSGQPGQVYFPAKQATFLTYSAHCKVPDKPHFSGIRKGKLDFRISYSPSFQKIYTQSCTLFCWWSKLNHGRSNLGWAGGYLTEFWTGMLYPEVKILTLLYTFDTTSLFFFYPDTHCIEKGKSVFVNNWAT